MAKTIEKCTAWVLAAAILLSMACIGVFAEHAPFRYGDVNGDGNLSAADAMEVSKHTAAVIRLTGDSFKAADVNGDGIVSVKDAILIQQYVAKIINVFPVEQMQPTDPTVQPNEPTAFVPTESPAVQTTTPTAIVPSESPAVQPNEPTAFVPTESPAVQPTQPETYDALVNGKKTSVGNEIVYTAYLYAKDLVAGVNACVNYTSDVLKVSDITLNSEKIEILPILANGSSALNFVPVDGTNSVYFNGANTDEGYNFSANDSILVTVRFDVIGAGTASIETAIVQILSMELDSTNNNLPLEGYTLTDETKVVAGTIDPTEPTDPTELPTEQPTEAPTQKPSEQPTTPPAADAVVNGQRASIGDQVVYTAYLKADELVAGVNAHVTYTGGVLKLSDETLASKKDKVIPVLATGSAVLNFEPVDATDSVYFNGANTDEGYNFSANDSILVTVRFDVIGTGTASIETAIAQILSMELDSTNKNLPLEGYTLTDETKLVAGTIDPTEPTDPIEPTDPTEVPTEQPTTPPASDAVVNGQKASIGDQVVYTAYLKADELVAGVNAHVTYTGGVLKLSDETLASKKDKVIPVLATGSAVLNFEPVDATDSVYFNGANTDEGYDFSASQTVLVTLTFDVIGAGTASIETAIAQILSMELDSTNNNLPLEGYTLTDETKLVAGTIDPTEPANDALVNGVGVNIGDQVTYTAYISADEAAAGIVAYVPYMDSVLRLSDETLADKKSNIIPNFATGSSVLNYTPFDGSSAVYFNSADPDKGYQCPEGSVLVTLTFDVIGKGTATIAPHITQFLSMRKDADGNYMNLTGYHITSDLIKK